MQTIPGIVSHIIRKNEQPPTFTICTLLYGEYPQLAARCLESILSLPDTNRWELRIGMNAVCEETRQYVNRLFQESENTGWRLIKYDSQENICKYPMMRWMFNDHSTINSPYIMWFDDDSYIKTPTAEWLDSVERTMFECDMCGQPLTCQLQGNQEQWIRMQSWYKGKEVQQPTTFVAGGWWTIITDVIKKLMWPPVNIIHRGGDQMLGEALYQNGFKIKHFTDGLGINTKDGKYGTSERRGLDPLPVGIDYEPQLTTVLHDATRSIKPEMLDYPGL